MPRWPADFAIAVTLTDVEPLSKIRKALRSVTLPLVLEIRIDRFRRFEERAILERIQSVKELKIPLLGTIRSRREGGGRTISDSERVRLFKKILPWVDAIDLELSSEPLVRSLMPLARRRGKRVILSYHNFKSTPRDGTFLKLIRKAKRKGADLVKLAATPEKKGDLARFLLLTHRERDQHLIAIAMGRYGIPSRTLAPLFGSLLTYSFIGRPQAPGQLPLKRLLQEMHPFFSSRKPRRKR